VRRAASGIVALAIVAAACSSGDPAPGPAASAASSAPPATGTPIGSATAEVRRGPPPGDVASRRVAALDLLDGLLGAATLPLEATDDGGPVDLGLRDELNPRGGLGRVHLDGVEISGRLPPEAVLPVLEGRIDRVRGCYDRGRARNPQLQGQLSIEMKVRGDGVASSVAQEKADIPDGGVIACVLRVFEGLQLPSPAPGLATITFRWRFEPIP
jgi:hypothetical protein